MKQYPNLEIYNLSPIKKAQLEILLKLQFKSKGDHVKFIYPKHYSKKFLSWVLIKKDLIFCANCLLELANYSILKKIEINKTVEQSLWYSFVITYGKCFAQTKGWVKMDITFFSSEKGKKFKEIHNKLKELRNRFVAHREDSEHEQIIAFSRIKFDVKEGDLLQIETEEIRNEGPTIDEFENYTNLLEYLIDIAENEVQKSALKLNPKFITDTEDPENWKYFLIKG